MYQVHDKTIEFQLDLDMERRKAFLAACNAHLLKERKGQQEFILGRRGREAAEALSDVMDELIRNISTWLLTEAKITERDVQGLALVAQGGYGRRQLNPYSDVDLLILMPDNPKPVEQAFVKSLLYMLWDINKIELGHCTKKLSEAVGAVGYDLDSTTALLELRTLFGNEKLTQQLRSKVEHQVRGPSRRWFVESKLAESRNRKEKFGSSVYLLEPNVKEGEGGLRDVHSLKWLAYALVSSSELELLAQKELLSPEELRALNTALDFLLSVRTALHLSENRKADSLSFDKQQVVASALGYTSDPQLLAEEKMMKDYYFHAHIIDRLSLKATRQMTMKARSSVGGMFEGMRRRSLNADYYIKAGMLYHKTNDATFFKTNPSRVMECFRTAGTAGVIISEELKTLIEEVHEFTDTHEFRTSPVCRDHFMKIMAQKQGAGAVVHAMHETGILADYMPEFRKLFCLVRIDHYHRYTVDEHLIRTLYESEELYTTGAGQRADLVNEARVIKRWDLLNLSLLLHDIGKGEGHGHVLRGAVISQKMTERMGLLPEEQEVVRQLILQHLKMVHISQRRDLEDPHVIAEMAGTVPDPELLRMLYILTYCDTRAVGPTAWSEWKGMLLGDLYRKTLLALEGKDPIPTIDEAARARIQEKITADPGNNEQDSRAIARFVNNVPPKYLLTVPPAKMVRHMDLLRQLTEQEPAAWHLDEPEHMNYTEISVVAPDVRGLLSMLCGALSSKDINILSMQAFSTKDGHAIDVFQVTDLRGNKLPHGFRLDRLKSGLNMVLNKTKTVEEAFPIRRRARPQSPDISVVKPAQVLIDNEGSPDYTILEVKAYDRPGLLHDVTAECNEQSYFIHLAMITTEAYRVVDVFYLTDPEFNKLDMMQVKKLKTALEAVV